MADLSPTLFGRTPPGQEPARPIPARVVHLGPGAVQPDELIPDPRDWIGVLILDGLLLVELDAGRAHAGWLLGADDLVRPWSMADLSLTRASGWRALTAVQAALLDREFSLRAGGIPVLARALVERAAQTTNWLLAKSLILASPLVEERLLLAFALFAERWGTVNSDGILVRLPLTHAVLATLCGVRRPSVTLALHSLQSAGLLTRRPGGEWLLHRRSVEELGHLPSCWPQYANALGLAAAAIAE